MKERSEQSRERGRKWKEVVNFVRVSPLQHAGAVIYASFLYPAVEAIPEVHIVTRVGATLAVAGFCELVAVGHFSEYRKIKRILKRRGWNRRLVEPATHSWCQRRLAKVAASETGYKKEIKEYYADQGHKWYHFIPEKRKK